MSTRTSRRSVIAVAALSCAALALAACSSSSSSSSTSSGSQTAAASTTSSEVAKAGEAVSAAEVLPTKILITQSFKPKAGGFIYNIACDQALVGCHVIAEEIQQAATAIGYKYQLCNAGTTPDQASECFTNAINAKPSAIVTNAVGVTAAGNGYAAAKKAGIPIVGIFTGNDPNGSVSNAEVGGSACVQEGQLTADGVIASSDGSANVLYLGESSIACDVQRQQGFQQQLATCSGCHFTLLQFDTATIETSLPQQLQAKLDADPSVNWIVGTYDQAAQIAVTQVQQQGLQSKIKVAGMDGDPANVQYILSGQVQQFDAAARIYSGLSVPDNIPVTIFIIAHSNASQLGSAKSYGGPAAFENQFKALWGLS
jgi:ribose transport system substrate-binding protein